jgi:hypothetical protein
MRSTALCVQHWGPPDSIRTPWRMVEISVDWHPNLLYHLRYRQLSLRPCEVVRAIRASVCLPDCHLQRLSLPNVVVALLKRFSAYMQAGDSLGCLMFQGVSRLRLDGSRYRHGPAPELTAVPVYQCGHVENDVSDACA